MAQFPFPRVLDFVGKLAPFSSLEGEELAQVVGAMKVAFFAKGAAIMEMGGEPAQHLHIVHSGVARISLEDEVGHPVLVDFRSEGEFFGSVSLLQGRRSLFHVHAEEDLIAFLLPADMFKDLVDRHREFQRYFSLALVRDLRGRRFPDQAQPAPGLPAPGAALDTSLIGRSVGELMQADLLTCGPDTPLHQAAELMTSRRVSSIVARGEDGALEGIVTDTDLRSRGLARRLDPAAPISQVMTTGLCTIPPQASAYDALLTMTRHDVSHLMVSDQGRTVGIVSMHDLQRAMGSTPLGIVADIGKCAQVDQLVELHREVMVLQEGLMRRGGPVKTLVGLVAELNERFTLRLMDLAQAAMESSGRGAPPVGFCWLALGSGGRKEQTLNTDQDNALVFEDPPPGQEAEAKAWFLDLADMVVEGLARCGFPRDIAGMLASQPNWCHARTEWGTKALWWMKHPYDRTLLKACLFFDFRGLGEGAGLAGELRAAVNQADKREKHTFLRYLAKNSLYNSPPLGFMRQFVVERDGERKNQLDLKNKGLLPVVELARALALELSLGTTNTFERLEAIGGSGLLDEGLTSDVIEAYGFMTSLRINTHLRAMSQGGKGGNFVDPDRLGSLNRKLLKESFRVVERAQDALRKHYLTDQLKDI